MKRGTEARRVEAALRRWGRAVQIFVPDAQGGTVIHREKGILHPLLYKDRRYLSGDWLPLGYSGGGHYLYFGPADSAVTLLQVDGELCAEGKRYLLRRAEQYYLREKPLYCWAVLEESGPLQE